MKYFSALLGFFSYLVTSTTTTATDTCSLQSLVNSFACNFQFSFLNSSLSHTSCCAVSGPLDLGGFYVLAKLERFSRRLSSLMLMAWALMNSPMFSWQNNNTTAEVHTSQFTVTVSQVPKAHFL